MLLYWALVWKRRGILNAVFEGENLCSFEFSRSSMDLNRHLRLAWNSYLLNKRWMRSSIDEEWIDNHGAWEIVSYKKFTWVTLKERQISWFEFPFGENGSDGSILLSKELIFVFNRRRLFASVHLRPTLYISLSISMDYSWCLSSQNFSTLFQIRRERIPRNSFNLTSW